MDMIINMNLDKLNKKAIIAYEMKNVIYELQYNYYSKVSETAFDKMYNQYYLVGLEIEDCEIKIDNLYRSDVLTMVFKDSHIFNITGKVYSFKCL